MKKKQFQLRHLHYENTCDIIIENEDASHSLSPVIYSRRTDDAGVSAALAAELFTGYLPSAESIKKAAQYLLGR